MPRSEKDRMASEVEERWIAFQDALSDKRKYPIGQFKAFWEAGKRYAEMTKRDPLVHRAVVKAVNPLDGFPDRGAQAGSGAGSSGRRAPGEHGLRWR